MEKVYDPSKVEDRLYQKWLEKKYFHAEVDRSRKPFTIVIPPPNITGQLHMGHALDNTLQDILIRWKRMQGYNTLWMPGTDHASIATEVKIVQKMAEEGLTKQDLGRQGFLKRAWAWKEQYGGTIIKQLQKLGSSCDWDRERFTMDEGLSKAVLEVFVRLYEKGWIYRGVKIINWCPVCQTTISDAEVEHVEKGGHFWHIRYPMKDGSGYIQIATTRPETMLGDTAVAVHPEDERYKDFIGKTVILPLVNREIPVVADEYVDREFGTGVVKITPAHDPNDFEVGLRHNLPQINIMNDDGTLNEAAGKYAGLDRYEARKLIVKDLEEQGYLVKIEDHVHNVGLHDRCNTVIEPMIKMQWFVKMEELAKPAIEVLKNGKLRFVPERFGKVYLHWLENIRDWCISRQLWWGHRIPAYYCDQCGHIEVAKETPKACSKCGCTSFKQDEDTLDTWFSSALWPFSTLGWPDKTEELDYFYPTDVLVTGYDIIFFWVVRMVFSGLEQMGDVPFKDVLIHGLVRDSQGRKMSKSLGNGVDPLEIIEKYGADALRLTLVTGNAPGNDMRFYYERVEASRNFGNKIWNATRFILMNLEGEDEVQVKLEDLTAADKWILSKVNTLAKEVTENMDKYELGIAVSKLYDFFWEEFCDWYIEMVKPRLYNKEDNTRKAALWTLKTVLINALKLLHPYMPFITEEIFTNIQNEEETIMLSAWPEFKEEWKFSVEEDEIELMKQAIRNIRNLRAEMNVPPSKKAKLIVVSEDDKVLDIFERGKVFFASLAYGNEVLVQKDKTGVDEDAVSTIIPGATIYIPFAELVDISKEIERLQKEKEKLIKEVERVEKKLSNKGFVEKAPQNVIEEEKEKQVKYKTMLEQVEERLKALSKK
ncbi:MAG: valyl-tRNA synthetase [Epulopiscium sp.]|jgi:valyl-tRNA synthetase|uniref:Valine--tRNA ligase n=1 Tax=Defluviitalea raffinosedens TaxID=1450156 RepID=A0A7C8LIY0_9FIRM|nr:valine--tRNA ligase [Defluviitalea raffinosedens]KAE9633425.1 valine--tRNA ligase [Defluviitalea raffinosedens]MBZ4667974.1 valyl-tRNA synthetase [Defluviitaleaceae bacterium]MDK2787872.1 valyl-tRNA synthetase [Candidatus Epulonipiscium sp.]